MARALAGRDIRRPMQYTLAMCRGLTLLLVILIAPAWAAPETALAHLGAANHLMSAEQYGEAANEFQKALELNNSLLAARRDLAVCRFELRQYDVAKQLLSELLKHRSTNSLGHYYLGRIDLAEGNVPSAIAQFRSIPIGQPFRDERYFLGKAYFKSSQFERCVRMLQQAIGENPRDFRSHQLLARALVKLGRNGAAAREFAETRRLLNYYTEGSQALKRCAQLLSTGSGADAEKVCGPQLETDDVDKLASVGMVFGKYGQYEKAREVWLRAASLDPDSAEIRYNLALTCFHLKNTQCAYENAKAAMQRRAEFPEANVLYASILYMKGADEEALPALRKAHLLNPNDGSIRQLLGNELMLWAEHYAKTGKLGEARALGAELDGLRPLQHDQEARREALRRLLAEE